MAHSSAKRAIHSDPDRPRREQQRASHAAHSEARAVECISPAKSPVPPFTAGSCSYLAGLSSGTARRELEEARSVLTRSSRIAIREEGS